jgi:competence protein ComEA
VPGIGDKRAAKLSAEGLTVNGDAFKGAAPKAAAKLERVATKAGAPAPTAKAESKQ